MSPYEMTWWFPRPWWQRPALVLHYSTSTNADAFLWPPREAAK